MKINQGKIINLIVLNIIFGIALVHVNTNDPFKSTREGLIRLYESRFDDCKIINIQKRIYPRKNEEKYSVFYTNCNMNSYPIILEYNNHLTDTKYFKNGAILSKQPNSLSILIEYEGKKYNTVIRDPKIEDTRGEGTIPIIIFMLIGTILIFILPSSMFNFR